MTAAAPAIRVTRTYTAPLIPDWRDVAAIVPPDFRNDGSSDPVLLYLLGVLAFVPWCKRAAQVINEAGRLHDFGYGPGRLTGSGYSHVRRSGWDQMYARQIADCGHPWIARRHRWALDKFGQRAWDKWERTMRRWEWHTFQDFLDDRDHKYGYGRRSDNADIVL